MLNTEKLIQLNAELEGLLRVLSHRDSSNLRNILIQKYSEYRNAFDELISEINQEPVASEPQLTPIEEVDHALSVDIVKVEEAETGEIADETELAAKAIERGEKSETEITAIKNSGRSDSTETHADEVTDTQERGETQSAENMQQSLFDQDEDDIHEHHPLDEKDIEEIRSAHIAEINKAKQPEELKPGSHLHVDEMLSKKAAIDLRHAFTLNDKFGFRRSLFNQDDAKFSRALEELAMQPSFEEARRWMVEKYGWDLKNADVDDFMSIIKRHYPN